MRNGRTNRGIPEPFDSRINIDPGEKRKENEITIKNL